MAGTITESVSTRQTKEATLSPMLATAVRFCTGPVVRVATMARMIAGMAQTRLLTDMKSSAVQDRAIANLTNLLFVSAGGDTVVTAAVG